jgi:sulfur carrier protein ThiS
VETFALKVNLKLIGQFIEIFQMDESQIELEPDATVLDLLHAICKTDEQRKRIFVQTDRTLRPNVTIRKNGMFIIYLDWLDTELREGDRVDILTMHSGG